jgi:hypothetical protein
MTAHLAWLELKRRMDASGRAVLDALVSLIPDDLFDVEIPAADSLAERGRQLASQREDLIVQGVDPAELVIPIHPEPRRRPMTRVHVLAEIEAEQAIEYGSDEDHPDGTGFAYLREHAKKARHERRVAFASGRGTWRHLLRAKYRGALACKEPDQLRAELIQVAAAAVAWVEAIDRRESHAGADTHQGDQ